MYCSLLRHAETFETPGSSCPSPLTGLFFYTKCIFERTIFYSNFLTGLFFAQNVFLNAPYFTQFSNWTLFYTKCIFEPTIFYYFFKILLQYPNWTLFYTKCIFERTIFYSHLYILLKMSKWTFF